jgi:hypothetical protein
MSVVCSCCWSSPAHSFSGPSPAGLTTTFYCLRFETPPTWRARSPYLHPPGTGWPGYTPRHWVFFFIASYDSQGTVLTRVGLGCSLYSLGADPQKAPFPFLPQKYLDCCLIICCRRNVFTELFTSNERLL